VLLSTAGLPPTPCRRESSHADRRLQTPCRSTSLIVSFRVRAPGSGGPGRRLPLL